MSFKDIVFIFLLIIIIILIIKTIYKYIIKIIKSKKMIKDKNKRGSHYAYIKRPIIEAAYYDRLKYSNLIITYNKFYMDFIGDGNCGYYAIIYAIYKKLQEYNSFLRSNFFSNIIFYKLSKEDREKINKMQNKIKNIIELNPYFQNLSTNELALIIKYIKIYAYSYFKYIYNDEDRLYFVNTFEEDALDLIYKPNEPIDYQHLKIISDMFCINFNIITIAEKNINLSKIITPLATDIITLVYLAKNKYNNGHYNLIID